jgi:hypothetical protein
MRRVVRSWYPLVLLVLLGPLAFGTGRRVMAQRPQAPSYPLSSQYRTSRIEGWTVLVNEEFLRRRPAVSERTLTLLRHQLYQIVRKLPAAAVRRLRTIRIWVEEEEPNTRCMAYHPQVKWLEEHGVNPAKHKCVELANARNFLEWTLEQPWMVLHELAHAYHHQFLEGGFDNPAIKKAYNRAVEAKLYRSVLRQNGRE